MNETGGEQQRPDVKGGAAPGDARRAPESGEPADAGRSHGRLIDENGAPLGGAGKPGDEGAQPMPGRTDEKGNQGRLGEDLESGRQDTM